MTKNYLIANLKENAEGLNYLQHVRFAIELDIAKYKIHSVGYATNNSYPEKTWGNLLNVHGNFIILKSLLDEQLFLEQKKNNLSLKARTIYYKGLGKKVIQLQGLDASIIPTVSLFFTGKKLGFTVEQYRNVQRRLEEVKDLFWFLQASLLLPYGHKPNIGKQLQLIYNSLERAQTKLESRLKKKHGETDKLFTTPKPERSFLDGSLTDLAPSARYIANYIKALDDDNNKAIWHLEELAENAFPPPLKG